MKFLLANDDGFYAPGLVAIKRELLKLGEVTIVAPEYQKSAFSHSITLFDPLMIKQHFVDSDGVTTYCIGGTPADCVKLALKELLPTKPDMVVSGINLGLNTGSNILYSGTVAGALEASQFNITAIAVSLEISENPDYKNAAIIGRKIIECIAKNYKRSNITFNINIPKGKLSKMKGVKITREESCPYEDSFEKRHDPRGQTYYWLKGSPEIYYRPSSKCEANPIPSDAWAISKGFISITPLIRDLTCYKAIPLAKKLIKLNLAY